MSKRLPYTILTTSLAVFCLAGRGSGQGFTRITQECGIRDLIKAKIATDTNWWNTGILLIDLDGDGDLDFFNGAHVGTALAALNDGHGKFTKAPGTYPATEIHIPYDINEDGKIDLSMTYNDGGGQWWSNNSTPGNLSFVATGITRPSARSQTMIDVNRDGKIDWIFDGNMSLGTGTGSFLSGSVFAAPSSWDIDGDGDLDRFVSKDGGYGTTPRNSHIYRNSGNLQFTEITPASLSTGEVDFKAIGDYDQDGDADIVAIINKTFPPRLFQNDGAGNFTEKPGAFSGSSGTNHYEGWGTGIMTDFDNDGIADCIMDGRNFLHIYRGTGNGNFQYMNSTWKITNAAPAAVDEGICFGDIDADGDLDVIGYGDSWPADTVVVYRNDLPARNWINVRPVGIAGNKGAANAKIRVFEAGTSMLVWYEQVAIYCAQSQQSYYAYSQTERHFGLGDRVSCDVEVEFFPSGVKVKASAVQKNTTVVLRESGAVISENAAFKSVKRNRLEVIQNPHSITVRFDRDGKYEGKMPKINLFDMSGRLIKKITFDTYRPVNSYSWNTDELPSGVYFLKLDADYSTYHFIVQ